MSKHARRPAVRPALSPREPAPLRAGTYGTAGRAADTRTADPTDGRRGTTCPHPKRNTLRNSRQGSPSIRNLLRDVPPAPALERSSAPTPARVTNRRLVQGLEGDIRLAGESEGLRVREAAAHSLKVRTGAVRVDTVLMNVADESDPTAVRIVPVPVPVWQSDLCPSCTWTPDSGRLVRRCAECQAELDLTDAAALIIAAAGV